MKYFIISERGDYLPIAIKLKEEGHNVRFYVSEQDRRNIGKNLVDCVSNIAQDADIYVLDMKISSDMARKIRGKCFTASEFTDYFCTDVEYFAEICQLLDIDFNTAAIPDHGIEAWFNGNRFVLPVFNHTYFNELLAGGVGSVVPEHMGIVTTHEYHYSDLFNSTLKKLESPLKRVGYKGIMRLDLASGEVCYPSTSLSVPTLTELLDVPLSMIIEQCINGELKYVKCNRARAVGLKISIPPFPYCPRYFWQHGRYHMNGLPLFKYDRDQVRHMWLTHVMKDGNGTILASGHSGDLGYVTSRSDTSLKEAGRRIRRTIANLGIKDIQYRTDIC